MAVMVMVLVLLTVPSYAGILSWTLTGGDVRCSFEGDPPEHCEQSSPFGMGGIFADVTIRDAGVLISNQDMSETVLFSPLRIDGHVGDGPDYYLSFIFLLDNPAPGDYGLQDVPVTAWMSLSTQTWFSIGEGMRG